MRPKRVLVTPLNWGLGHATRCIPIIRELINKQCEVVLASDGDALALLKGEFPTLPAHELMDYKAHYSDSNSMVFTLVRQLPRFVRVIAGEHKQVEEIVSREGIDLVISDNRFGAWSGNVPNVLITHQVNIVTPSGVRWLQPLINFFNHKHIKKFSACWIPDFPGSVLSGKLSDPAGIPHAKFIGPLSRFSRRSQGQPQYDLLAVLSGPEPQRSKLEKILLDQFKRRASKSLIVRGVMGNSGIYKKDGVDMVDFLPSDRLNEVFENSALIICRSGYSTIMDLAKLGKNAILIPTPGQPEQEYLASHFHEIGVAYSVRQSDVDLKIDMEKSRNFSGFVGYEFENDLLIKAIEELLL